MRTQLKANNETALQIPTDPYIRQSTHVLVRISSSGPPLDILVSIPQSLYTDIVPQLPHLAMLPNFFLLSFMLSPGLARN